MPFRLDYLVKIGTLRRLGGIRIGLEAIALSIVSLGMVDAVAMLPLSISATAISPASFRGPLLIVVAFGVGCLALLLASVRLVRLPLLRRSGRLQRVSHHVSVHKTPGRRRNAIVAGVYLFTCWTTRALGSTLLLRYALKPGHNVYQLETRLVSSYPMVPPETRVLTPLKHCPHLLEGQTLCLWRQGSTRMTSRWDPSRFTCVFAVQAAWRWLACYEIWHETGEWPLPEAK